MLNKRECKWGVVAMAGRCRQTSLEIVTDVPTHTGAGSMAGSGKCGDPCSPLWAERKRGQALNLAGRRVDSREGQLGKVYGELKVGYSRLA